METVKILSVNFIDEANMVEITYLESREQTKDAGVMRTVAFSADKFSQQREDILEIVRESLDEVLEDIRLNRE